MNDHSVAIKVDNITKCFRIGVKEQTHDTLGVSAWNFLKRPLVNFRKYRSLYTFDDVNPDQIDGPADVLWALRGVSFEVKVGEIIGIIGINGAGKSTLLKILSKITPPTSGRATIRGRVSSLLEVGTGFHPELTGRENIYLNGTILGMRKKEIDRNFEEIVDFSGIEKFIETPVKRYSSGMRVRLAFSVAAHLEPEVLLIDEVLAVGDARFQKKCLSKMQDVSKHGRTVLFVSHNMPAITRLCPRTVLLDGGRVLVDGPSHEVVGVYMTAGKSTTAERVWSDLGQAPGDDVVRLRAVRVKTEDGQVCEAVDIQQPIKIEFEYEVLKPGFAMRIYYHVVNEEGIEVCTPLDNDMSWQNKARPVGRYVSISWIPGNLLSEGILYFGPSLRTLDPEIRRFRVNEAVAFQVVDRMEGGGARGGWGGALGGVVRPLLQWETQFTPTKKNIPESTLAP
jgi:lipopolysaccharide transport system ATP-binding protein